MSQVLVVEDDRAHGYALSRLIESYGLKTFCASGVEEAIGHLASRPEYVVMDWRMPAGGGRRIMESIRDQGLTSKVAVVTVAYEELHAQIAATNPDAIFKVPFQTNALHDWFISHGACPKRA